MTDCDRFQPGDFSTTMDQCEGNPLEITDLGQTTLLREIPTCDTEGLAVDGKTRRSKMPTAHKSSNEGNRDSEKGTGDDLASTTGCQPVPSPRNAVRQRCESECCERAQQGVIPSD